MKIKILLPIFFFVAILSISFKNKTDSNAHPLRSFGAAAVFNQGFSGAPFDNSGYNCGICHSGGSFNPTITLELIDGSNNIVTSYSPGQNYIVRLSIIPTSGTPKFGFQLMSVKASDNSNLNTWGSSLPTEVKNVLTTAGRNYIEHNSRLNSGILDIPWTAPASATGDVTFYGAGNAVNVDFTITGDATGTANLTVTESALPITLSSFEGREEKGIVKLNWSTTQEINNDYFLVQHSVDGINFSNKARIESQGNTSVGFNYNYDHKNAVSGRNYYRLKQVDEDGSFTYSNLVTIKNNSKRISIYPNPVTNEIILSSYDLLDLMKYRIIDASGKILITNNINSTKIDVKNLPNGNYVLAVTYKNGENSTFKFVKK